MCASLLLSQALPAPLSRACARSDSKSALPPRQHSASSSSRPHRGSLHETPSRDERRIPGRRATPTGAAGPVPRWHSPAPTPGHTCTRNSLSSERRIASRYGAQRFALFLRIRPFLVLCTSSCDARFSTSPHNDRSVPSARCLPLSRSLRSRLRVLQLPTPLADRRFAVQSPSSRGAASGRPSAEKRTAFCKSVI